MKIKEKLRNSSFLKTYLLILIPIIIILIFMVAVLFSFSKNYRRLIKESYTSTLTMVCDRGEDSVQNIINIVQMLSLDTEFMKVLTKQEEDVTQNDIYEATRTLNSLKDKNWSIDSAIVVNRVQQIEYGTMGTYPLGEFFDDVYKYNDYSYSYWKYYQAPVTDKQILPPSTVTKFAGNENVIPIVFTHIGNKYLNSLLIVNIKVADLFDLLEKNKLTENSFFYLINKQLEKAYTRNSVSEYAFDKAFYDISISDLDTDFTWSLDSEKYMVVSHSPYDSVLGYAYVVFVPERDISRVTLNFMLFIGALGILVLVVVLFVIGVSVQQIYKPIESLTKKIVREKSMDDSQKEERDPLVRLNRMVDYMQSKNDELQMKIESSLPLIQERNLITILNQNEHYAENVSEVLLNETLTEFKYDMFCSVIIGMSPTNRFYHEYNDAEYSHIYNGLRVIIKNLFAERYETYMMPCEVTDAVYILLNLKDDVKKEEVLEVLDNINHILIADSEYMTVDVACGGIYTGIKGLRKSHREAMKEISGKTNLESMQIEINRDHKIRSAVSEFQNEDRLHLADLLLLGKAEQAMALIKKVVLDNLRRNVSDENLVTLYKQIIGIIFKVLRCKNIPFDTGGENDDKFINKLSGRSADDVFKVIDVLIRDIARNAAEIEKVDIHAIALYVDFHYREGDCGVEKTAEVFETGAKYISQKFKDIMGVNFTDYLAEKRVSAAKALLETTDKSIGEIGEEVGYPIKSTFIRAFRRVEGVSPTEFRSGISDSRAKETADLPDK